MIIGKFGVAYTAPVVNFGIVRYCISASPKSLCFQVGQGFFFGLLGLAARVVHHAFTTGVELQNSFDTQGGIPRTAARTAAKIHELESRWAPYIYCPPEFVAREMTNKDIISNILSITKLWQHHRPGIPLYQLWDHNLVNINQSSIFIRAMQTAVELWQPFCATIRGRIS